MKDQKIFFFYHNIIIFHCSALAFTPYNQRLLNALKFPNVTSIIFVAVTADKKLKITPISNVNANPFIGPLPKYSSTHATIIVVTFESSTAVNAFLYPTSMHVLSVLP